MDSDSRDDRRSRPAMGSRLSIAGKQMNGMAMVRNVNSNMHDRGMKVGVKQMKAEAEDYFWELGDAPAGGENEAKV